MNISLTPELENYVNEKVQSGNYASPTEVIREGLSLLREQDQIRRLRREELIKEVTLGVEQVRNGNFKKYNSPEELGDEIIRRATEKQARKG